MSAPTFPAQPHPAPPPGRRRLYLLLALAGVLILLVTLAWPRRWYNDDTFITLRYASNVAAGHGVVWNTVEPVRVEGSTSPGWMLMNAGAIASGLDPLVVSHLAGLFAALAGLWLVTRSGERDLGLPAWLAVAAALSLALGRQWVVWSVSAMETTAATVVALAATIRMAREVGDNDGAGRRPWVSGLLFFVATLLRPEIPLLHLAAGVGLAAVRRTRDAWRAIAVSGASHAVLLAGLVLFRVAYFGRPLPNTFYAKVGGLELEEGARYLGQFLVQTHAWLWLPLAVAGAIGTARRRPLAAALAAQVLALAAWVVAVGGDAWEFRFFVPLLPALALLAAAGIDVLAVRAPRRRTVLAVALAVALVGSQAATLVRPFRTFGAVDSSGNMRAQADEMLRQGRALARYLSPADRIATGWAGALPYVSGAWHLDVWGLNDPEIAGRPFDRNEVLYHRRRASWEDIVARRVMFADIYNDFFFRRPFLPPQVPQPVMPWARDGILVYCVEVPEVGEDRFWIFASPRPQEEVLDWLKARRLPLRYVTALRLRP
jgi:hypothetical protein